MFYLLLAILFEVIGSAFLKLSNGFTNLIPSMLLILFYGCSFVFIVLALKTIPLSVGYSIWAGLGTAGAAFVGIILFNESLSALNLVGLVIIIGGVVLMNISKEAEQTERKASP